MQKSSIDWDCVIDKFRWLYHASRDGKTKTIYIDNVIGDTTEIGQQKSIRIDCSVKRTTTSDMWIDLLLLNAVVCRYVEKKPSMSANRVCDQHKLLISAVKSVVTRERFKLEIKPDSKWNSFSAWDSALKIIKVKALDKLNESFAACNLSHHKGYESVSLIEAIIETIRKIVPSKIGCGSVDSTALRITTDVEVGVSTDVDGSSQGVTPFHDVTGSISPVRDMLDDDLHSVMTYCENDDLDIPSDCSIFGSLQSEADATRYPSPADWNNMKKSIWQALKVDDSVKLQLVWRDFAKTRGLCELDLILKLDTKLWKPSTNPRRTSLLAAAAGNQSGVPDVGCLNCIDFILKFVPQDTDRVSDALFRAQIAKVDKKLPREEAISKLLKVSLPLVVNLANERLEELGKPHINQAVDTAEEEWTTLRTSIWRALKSDNSDDLIASLSEFNTTKAIDPARLIELLDHHLWNHKRLNSRRICGSLLEAAAGNIQGIPPSGCISCIKGIISYSSPKIEDVGRAIFRARIAKSEHSLPREGVIELLSSAEPGAATTATALFQEWLNKRSVTENALGDNLSDPFVSTQSTGDLVPRVVISSGEESPALNAPIHDIQISGHKRARAALMPEISQDKTMTL